MSDIEKITEVQVYIEFRKIGEIDTVNEKFDAELYVESKWILKDENLTTYDPETNWNPNIYIENNIKELKETTNYEVIKQDDGNNLIVEKRLIKG